MKKSKNKKIIIIGILIILFIVCSVLGYTYVFYKLNPLEVTEISILQENFEIESDSVKVILSNQESVSSNINETSDDNKSSTGTSKVSNSSKKRGTSNGASGTSVSPASYTPKIEIPRTRIKYTIYSDMSIKNMEKGVVILCSDNGLNQPGNTVISGHNYVNGKLFSNNDKIQIGDLIYITDSSGQKITYSVHNKYLTDPNDGNYMSRDTGGVKEISLTTCTNDSSQRIIILARET